MTTNHMKMQMENINKILYMLSIHQVIEIVQQNCHVINHSLTQFLTKCVLYRFLTRSYYQIVNIDKKRVNS
jgi:hypothetical protein